MAVLRIVANIAAGHVEPAKRFYGEVFGMALVMDLGWSRRLVRHAFGSR